MNVLYFEGFDLRSNIKFKTGRGHNHNYLLKKNYVEESAELYALTHISKHG